MVASTDQPPSADSDGQIYDTIDSSFEASDTVPIGQTPPPEQLAHWFKTLLSVQKSAFGTDAFYEETARAVVDLIGLDRGLVLLRNGNEWVQTAGYSRSRDIEINFSSSILNKVIAKKRTIYCNPRGVDVHASLRRLEAAVGSPIFNDSQEVIGMLYGSRDVALHHAGHAIGRLEAQLVEMLANSVTAGLTRMVMLERLKQVEQLAAVGQALGYILHDLRGPLGNAQQLTDMLRPAAGRRDESGSAVAFH